MEKADGREEWRVSRDLKGCCFYNKPKQWILGTFRLARHVEDVVIFVLKWCKLCFFFSFLVCHRNRGTFVSFSFLLPVAATHVEKVPKYPKVKTIIMYYITCLNHIFVYHYKRNLQQNLYFFYNSQAPDALRSESASGRSQRIGAWMESKQNVFVFNGTHLNWMVVWNLFF